MSGYEADIEALLGDAPPAAPAKRRGRPPSRKVEPDAPPSPLSLTRHMRQQAMVDGKGAEDVMSGVTVPWLARVFNLDPVTVRKRLVGCPTLRARASGHTYDVAVAASYLVTPKMDAADFMKRMKSADIPPKMQEAYWSAVLKRHKAEENAGDLWRSDDVMDLMSDVLKAVRDAFQLFPTSMEREGSLTDKQRIALVAMMDDLQSDLHKRVLDITRVRETPSVASEIEEVTLV